MIRRWPLVFVIFAGLIALLVTSRSRAADVPVTREPHMEMTMHRALQPGDGARGDAILAAARAIVAKYANVADAERDGYKKFLPNIPLPEEHYTSRANAIAAQFGFDPNRPTSIIYRRSASGLAVEGVMYTAPNVSSETALDARVPLSLGTWHRHIDFCRQPGTLGDPRFGFAGTIHTRSDCDAAGGRFVPLVFNWMVHVWPLQTDPAKIWAVDADSEHAMGHTMDHGGGGIFDQATLPIHAQRLPSETLASAGDSARGAAIFAGNCASCHGAAGANGPDAPRRKRPFRRASRLHDRTSARHRRSEHDARSRAQSARHLRRRDLRRVALAGALS